MKKILAIMLSAMMLLALSACGTSASTSTAASTASSVAQQIEQMTGKPAADCKIGIIQLAEHVALDAARDGFIDKLVENGYSESNIDVQNAQGEIANCATIATKFVNDKVDLILAIATPAAQAAAQATTDIPILCTAVTDFVGAGLVNDNDAPGGNVSGTSDMNPIDQQVDLLMQLCPDAKTVGIMYCSAEDNSKIQAELAQTAMEAKGLKVNIYTAADVNDIQAVTTKASGEIDALYIPTDNLFAANIPTVSLVTEPAKLPVICGESGMVDEGGTATYGISYYNLGQMAGTQCVDILQNGADVAATPVGFAAADDLELTINEENAAAIGLEIPASLKIA
ncbi:MAG: ABC transporter substrate-binding protein [Clostridia bacterium]|jgi:putative tryptophan/tyrosine transport system substrate-binding protein|nr:ABC transporter substrate-binding protein [Clostridia bacterium]NLS86257.1 ABC transporter substrate-binding protein [Oscillospiraceae bacterium]